jgi:hypothetical protein
LGTAVETIFVPATETFTEVVLVLRKINVVSVVPVARILIPEVILIAVSPSIFTIRLSSTNTLFVTIPHGLPKQICAVLVRLVVSATSIVAILRRSVAVLPVLEAILILSYSIQIALLITQLRNASFALE